jgi:hypothetical protein
MPVDPTAGMCGGGINRVLPTVGLLHSDRDAGDGAAELGFGADGLAVGTGDG